MALVGKTQGHHRWSQRFEAVAPFVLIKSNNWINQIFLFRCYQFLGPVKCFPYIVSLHNVDSSIYCLLTLILSTNLLINLLTSLLRASIFKDVFSSRVTSTFQSAQNLLFSMYFLYINSNSNKTLLNPFQSSVTFL